MTTRKCYSKCRKVAESLCLPEECKFINGQTRKYCRLSYNYKMDENCVAHRKPSPQKRSRKQAKSAHNKTGKRAPSSTREKIAAFKARRAPNVIKRFMMRQDPNKRRARFLNTICSDAGVCIAFGKESDKIKKHFGGFVDARYMKPPIRRIGRVSANGFVNEIAYENEGYTANAILKSSATKGADNLLFEYLVGQFINNITRFCPCFVETYAWFLYKDEAAWAHTKKTPNNPVNLFVDALVLQNPAIQNAQLESACVKSKHIGLLIQHIKNAKVVSDKINSKFCKNELLYVLYQVYMPLSMLADIFTHYDLHQGNVLLYEPVHGSYIEYNYHLQDGTVVSFLSSYVVKIIDYGRSFFVNVGLPTTDFTHSSKSIYNTICRVKKCNPYCGAYVGFNWGVPRQDEKTYFISSSIQNKSHDLRLINDLLLDDRSTIERTNPDLYDIMNSVVYGLGMTNEAHKAYGTKEQTASKLPGKIVNVDDMHTALKDMCMQPDIQEANRDNFATKTKLGTLNIYTDGREMQYIPSTRTLPAPKAETPRSASSGSDVDYW